MIFISCLHRLEMISTQLPNKIHSFKGNFYCTIISNSVELTKQLPIKEIVDKPNFHFFFNVRTIFDTSIKVVQINLNVLCQAFFSALQITFRQTMFARFQNESGGKTTNHTRKSKHHFSGVSSHIENNV